LKFGSPFFGKAEEFAEHIDSVAFNNKFSSSFKGEISGEFFFMEMKFYWHITKGGQYGRAWFFVNEEDRQYIQTLEAKFGVLHE
jgi:hypothetical protein